MGDCTVFERVRVRACVKMCVSSGKELRSGCEAEHKFNF